MRGDREGVVENHTITGNASIWMRWTKNGGRTPIRELPSSYVPLRLAHAWNCGLVASAVTGQNKQLARHAEFGLSKRSRREKTGCEWTRKERNGITSMESLEWPRWICTYLVSDRFMRLYEHHNDMVSFKHAPMQMRQLILILTLPQHISAITLLSLCRAFFSLCPSFALKPQCPADAYACRAHRNVSLQKPLAADQVD